MDFFPWKQKPFHLNCDKNCSDCLCSKRVVCCICGKQLCESNEKKCKNKAHYAIGTNTNPHTCSECYIP
jgi:hypothetical protein